MIYILGQFDLSVRCIMQETSAEIESNMRIAGKTIVTVVNKPIADEGDFLILKDDEKHCYTGIVDNVEAVKEDYIYKINVTEMENIFRRKVVLTNEDIMINLGIEDFIERMIMDNFILSSDKLMNISYINIQILSHTKKEMNIKNSDGIFDFVDFLADVREYNGIFLEFEFLEGKLVIRIGKNSSDILNIDTTVMDVISCRENYKVDPISKIIVLSKESKIQFSFFLKTDMTITTDPLDGERAKGKADIITCEKDKDAFQKAEDTFHKNSYQHNIVFEVVNYSQVLPIEQLEVGKSVIIKTKNNGVYRTYISGIERKTNSNITVVTCGNMKITLLEKLRGNI